MANMQKYKSGSVPGLGRHYERSKDKDGQFVKHSNQDIDPSRTHLNYNLGPERFGTHLDFVKQRCSEVDFVGRSNTNVMCSWVVTAPKDLPEGDLRLFFEQTYKFLNDRYAGGSDRNIISAYVHMDETTPHMHYAFVPVVWDSKRGREKVSAKEAIDRRDLQTFHKDFSEYMTLVFGRDIGVHNHITQGNDKNKVQLEVARLEKERTKLEGQNKELQADIVQAQETLLNARREAVEARKEVEVCQSTLEGLKSKIDPLERKYEGLKNEVSDWRFEAYELEEKIGNLTKIKGDMEEQIGGLQKNLSELRSTAFELQGEVNDLEDKRGALTGEIDVLQRQIDDKRNQIGNLASLRAEYEAKKKYIAKAIKTSELSMMYPDYAEHSTRGFGKNKRDYITVPAERWAEKHISVNDVNYVKEMQASLERSINNFKKSQTGENYSAMKNAISRLENKNKSLEKEIDTTKRELRGERQENKSLVERVNKTLGNISQSAANEFVEEWKAEGIRLEKLQRGWDGPSL